MKNLKKLASALLAGAMLFSLSACGQKTASITNDNASAPATDSRQTDSTPDTTTSGSGKVLVTYYSASGNTKRVAEDIADAAAGSTTMNRSVMWSLSPPRSKTGTITTPYSSATRFGGALRHGRSITS